jgi:hypothetical protein
MQLDALLRSYYFFVKNPVPVKVLYSSSSPNYKQAYQLLKQRFASYEVEFIKEESFKNDLVKLVNSLTFSKLLFLVDDVVFKAKVDLQSFCEIDTNHYVPSLRMGEHLTYSYTTEEQQLKPQFAESDVYSGMISWKYNEGELDWAYPLSVDGHLFNYVRVQGFSQSAGL